jgi:hypothetical protein
MDIRRVVSDETQSAEGDRKIQEMSETELEMAIETSEAQWRQPSVLNVAESRQSFTD